MSYPQRQWEDGWRGEWLGNLTQYNETSSENIKRTGSHSGDRSGTRLHELGGLVVVVRIPSGAPCQCQWGPLTASGFGASVSGGSVNTASKDFASVTGGKSNEAKGLNASVSGGTSNSAEGDFTSVTGGSDNVATGFTASVSGGSGNRANGNYASISGGKRRDAVEQDSWRAGTLPERTEGSGVWR
jgi:hypothetical protein